MKATHSHLQSAPMFLLDRDANRIQPIARASFTELGLRERQHLQEWIADRPSCLGEELLILQKEFDGFDDTRERLDLLALDKAGNLVIVELKLDDSGRDVTWQCLKYASYCSTLKRGQVRQLYADYLLQTGSDEDAATALAEFLEVETLDEAPVNVGNGQRMILVAGHFRKEVTSTVLWLAQHGLRIQCIEATPFRLRDEVVLSLEQIIPIRAAEEYTISIAEKAREEAAVQEDSSERERRNQGFWVATLAAMNAKSTLFRNTSPGRRTDLGAASGMNGVRYYMTASAKYYRAEIYVDAGDADENIRLFEILQAQCDELPEALQADLTWEGLIGKRACRIKSEVPHVNPYGGEGREAVIQDLTDRMVALEAGFRPLLARL